MEKTTPGEAARTEHDNQGGSGGCDPHDILNWDRIAQAAIDASPVVEELRAELETVRETARRERGVKCDHCGQSKPGRYMRPHESGVWLCVDHLDCQEHAQVDEALEEVKRERDQFEEALTQLREGRLNLQRKCHARAYDLTSMAAARSQRPHFMDLLQDFNEVWTALGHPAFERQIPAAEDPEYLDVVRAFAAKMLELVLAVYPMKDPPIQPLRRPLPRRRPL